MLLLKATKSIMLLHFFARLIIWFQYQEIFSMKKKYRQNYAFQGVLFPEYLRRNNTKIL
jgi:hypothetical protein